MLQTLLADNRKIPHLPQYTLIAANVVPLIGVLAFGWQVATLLAVYWAETGVIGLYTLIKIIMAGADAGEEENQKSDTWILTGYKVFIAGFFCVHFGGFMLGHGAFLFLLFADMAPSAGFNFSGFFLAVLGLLISHGISFYRNYMQAGEYQLLTPQSLMGQPYKRVIIMHLVVIVGAFATTFIGNFEMVALALLVLLKTIVDLFSHWREHAQLRQP
jgi:hypothetical protein